MQLKSRVSVWAFSASITLVALLFAEALNFLIFKKEALVDTLAGTSLITVLVSIPITLFIGQKIHENSRLSTELHRLVNRDRLTDVATRDFFFDRMEREPEAYGVSLMIDIDLFKHVNDTYGHLVGDEVIKHVGGVLRQETRAEDIVCRFGGEEFVIFLHEADGDKGLLVAERIRMSIEACKIVADEELVSVTVSIGGSLKQRLEDINVSIKQADEALYRAKLAGRNRTVVDWMPSGLITLPKAS